MKPVKKLLIVLSLAAVSAVASAAALAGCSIGEGETSGHKHTYKTEWSYDETNHWHEPDCGDTTENSDTAPHDLKENVLEEATCTEDGLKEVSCKTCGYTAQVTIPATGHELEDVAAKAPTCEEEGYTAYKKCKNCTYEEGKLPLMKLPTHRYSSAWTNDEYHHWHAALCGCDRTQNFGNHTFNSENKCTTCGYTYGGMTTEELDKIFTFSPNTLTYAVTGLTDEGKALQKIEIPAYYAGRSVVEIASGAFAEGTFTEIVLPETVVRIGAFAFEDCAALETVKMSSALTTIGVQAFAGCTQLKAIDIPEGVQRLEANTFMDCANLASVTLPDGLTFIDNQVFLGCAKLTEIALPEGLTFIGQAAFKASGLVSITVPAMAGMHVDNDDFPPRIATYAFADCTALQTVVLPAQIKYDFGSWFEGCKSLVSVTLPFLGSNVSLNDSVCTDFGYVFGTKAQPDGDFVAVTENGTTYYIPKTLKHVIVLGGYLEAGAFDGCNMLETVELSADVRINAREFEDCTAVITQDGRVVFNPNAVAPTVELTADKATMSENDTATLTPSVTYNGGETDGEYTYYVYVNEGGNYLNADASYYVLTEGDTVTFKALVAGEYRIILSVVSSLGGVGEGQAEISVTASEITLGWDEGLTLTNGWLRLGAAGGEAAYSAEGYAFGYDAAVSSDNAAISATVADGKIVIAAEGPDTATLTLVYTHKTIAEKSFELELKVSVVSDLANSPVLGEDPFGGTYGTLIPATGLMLYMDAKDKDGAALGYDSATYEVVSKSLTPDSVGASVGYVADNKAYPFVLVEDFNSHTAEGTVTVKMTVKSGEATAAATKVFKVEKLADPDKVTGLNAYADKVMTNGHQDMDMDVIMEMGNRANVVMSKDGLLEHRAGADDWNPDSNMFCVSPEGADSFTVDFDFAVIKRTGSSVKTSFVMNFRTGNWNGWVGDGVSFYAEGQGTDTVSAGAWGNDMRVDWNHEGLPSAEVGKVFHIRLVHTVEGGKANFVFSWSDDGSTYHKWLSLAPDVSAEAGKIGAPVNAIQFRHEQGSFYIGNVKLTKN